MTTEKKHKKGFRCERAEKSVNYQRKAKILLCFRFKLKQRHQLPTAENCYQFEKKVRTLQFWTKTGKHFHLSDKQQELA